MNVVMIIPTGIGCTIGGHAGDANPAARLLGSVCENLVLHPNVVNASDLNEMPDNAWYVEGSMLDNFLFRKYYLVKPKSNKILCVCNDITEPTTVNSVNASMKTLGTDIKLIQLETPLLMQGTIEDDHATGTFTGANELVRQVSKIHYDALAIHTKIDVDVKVAMKYLHKGGINPYGAVEALVSKYIAERIEKPVAHAPVEELDDPYLGVVDPRMAASTISTGYLNSVLKGLHRAPRIHFSCKPGHLHMDDIDCLVTPINCFGPPHKAFLKYGKPIISVWDNKTELNDTINYDSIRVNTYLEAAGVISAMDAGVNLQSVMTKEMYKAKFTDRVIYENTKIQGCSA